MKVLVACESSGTVRDAFAARGHDAWSCDLLPSGGQHLQLDAISVAYSQKWDLMIAHPPCTYLTGSAAWAFGDGPYHQKVKEGTLVGESRRIARLEAIRFAEGLWGAPIERICVENPPGSLSTMSILGKPTQIIQPHDFGENASKRTGLHLKGLAPLEPTQYVEPRYVNGKPRWANQTDSGQNRLPPTKDRWQIRSKTYEGIAKAMAEQWG